MDFSPRFPQEMPKQPDAQPPSNPPDQQWGAYSHTDFGDDAPAPERRRALIVGGGIGGLTAAIALLQKGWTVSVCEAAPELLPIGKGIWVPTNAMQALDRLGVATAVAKAGWSLERIELCSVDGSVLTTIDLNQVKARYGHTTISIQRSALVECLAARLPSGVLKPGRCFVSFDTAGNRIEVRFADGSNEACELLVGADGIHSRVRDQLFPGVTLRYSGLTCYRGVSDLTLSDDLVTACREVLGGTSRFGYSAVGRRRVYWFAPTLAPAGGRDSADGLSGKLTELYARFPSPVPEILAAADNKEIIRTDLFDFPPIAEWHRGNVVLLGDAAHAMTPNLGQGGAQAIEDAYVLADQLAKAASIPEALAAYQRIRRPKAAWIVNTAWTYGRISHWNNPIAVRLRDLAFRSTPPGVTWKQLDRIYGLNY
jgi:2-polyprenyl-6-methoxyphenol hydroxylase-like FAD-dependent oxidoreductase